MKKLISAIVVILIVAAITVTTIRPAVAADGEGTLVFRWKGEHATEWRIEGKNVPHIKAGADSKVERKLKAGDYLLKCQDGSFEEIDVTIREGEETKVTPSVAHINFFIKTKPQEDRQWVVGRGDKKFGTINWYDYNSAWNPVVEKEIGWDVPPGRYKAELTAAAGGFGTERKTIHEESFTLLEGNHKDVKAPEK